MHCFYTFLKNWVFSGHSWSYSNARLIEDVMIEYIYQLLLKSLKPKLVLT